VSRGSREGEERANEPPRNRASRELNRRRIGASGASSGSRRLVFSNKSESLEDLPFSVSEEEKKMELALLFPPFFWGLN